MKQIIKDILPPILVKLSQKLVTKHKVASGKEQLVYSSYNEALKFSSNDAYEENELLEVIFKKTKRFAEELKSGIVPVWETSAYSIIGLINPIVESKKDTITVLDFAGACGAHYFHVRSLLSKEIKLKWVVVETNSMINYAKELENEELTFCDNFSDAKNKLGEIDLLHASSALQCVDNPDKYLNELLKCEAKWLLLNRLGFNKIDRDVVTIHASKLSWNGIGELPEGYTDRWIKYPFIFISENKFLNALKKTYKVVARFDDKSAMYPVDGEEIVGYGLMCKKLED
jgi:putative methyltransferase (TIGR04325 family)